MLRIQITCAVFLLALALSIIVFPLVVTPKESLTEDDYSMIKYIAKLLDEHDETGKEVYSTSLLNLVVVLHVYELAPFVGEEDYNQAIVHSAIRAMEIATYDKILPKSIQSEIMQTYSEVLGQKCFRSLFDFKIYVRLKGLESTDDPFRPTEDSLVFDDDDCPDFV